MSDVPNEFLIAAHGEPARVLVTGAAGHIGQHVVDELLARGLAVRAVTSRALTPDQRASTDVEWRRHDFMESLDVDSLVAGCDAVLHLAAALWDIPKMLRVNVEATRALASAAERRGLRFFGFASSVTVYGSARTIEVDETSPLLTGDQDLPEEYRGNPSIRAYGRSKVLAEQALAQEVATLECVIFRPTLVVDLPIMVAIARRPFLKHFLLGSRHEHHIFVKDVAHAMVWFLTRALHRTAPTSGVEIFNLADDDAPAVTGRAIAARAHALTQARQFRPGPAGPLWLYNLIDMAANKRLTKRYPFGMMKYSTKRLMSTGYRFKYGLEVAQRLAFTPFSSTASSRKNSISS
jgi:nucleoside-diphosphate-sugar epimerase